MLFTNSSVFHLFLIPYTHTLNNYKHRYFSGHFQLVIYLNTLLRSESKHDKK